MGFIKKAIVVAILAFAAKKYLTKPVEYPIFGSVAKGYEQVQEAFKANFEHGLEIEGASFAAYKDGELVVDLWGGFADREYFRPWQQDTMSVFFSSTKAVGAIVMAMLVDRGHMKYEDLVTKHWPEFGKHDKSNVTIAMVLSHQSGIHRTKEPLTRDILENYSELSRVIEETAPYWPPGTASGYHGLTLGFLEDQICSRVDPHHRNLSTFLQEEVLMPNNIKFSLGYDLSEHHRLARLTQVGMWQSIQANVRNSKIMKNTAKMIGSMMSSKSLMLSMMDSIPVFDQGMGAFTNPENSNFQVPAANGISTAREFAKIMNLFAIGKLVSPKLLKVINEPIREDTIDLCLGFPVSWGYGLMMTKNIQGNWVMGSPGSGGQMVKADRTNKLSYVYLTNGCGFAPEEDRFVKLERALYESLN